MWYDRDGRRKKMTPKLDPNPETMSSQVYFTKSQWAVGNSDKTNVQSSKSTVPLATT